MVAITSKYQRAIRRVRDIESQAQQWLQRLENELLENRQNNPAWDWERYEKCNFQLEAFTFLSQLDRVSVDFLQVFQEHEQPLSAEETQQLKALENTIKTNLFSGLTDVLSQRVSEGSCREMRLHSIRRCRLGETHHVFESNEDVDNRNNYRSLFFRALNNNRERINREEGTIRRGANGYRNPNVRRRLDFS